MSVMNPDFIKYLYDISQREDAREALLREAAEKAGADKLKVDAKPLEKAVRAMGVPGGEFVVAEGDNLALRFQDETEYLDAVAKLTDVSKIDDLATMGWYAVAEGDIASQAEPCGVLQIKFIETHVADMADKTPKTGERPTKAADQMNEPGMADLTDRDSRRRDLPKGIGKDAAHLGEARQVGSARVETLAEAGYTVVSDDGDVVVLKDGDGKRERWGKREDMPASYCLEYKGGYLEFLGSVSEAVGPVKIVACGSCGGYHRVDFAGDCREDSERFASPEDAEERLGVEVEEVDPESPEAAAPFPPAGVGLIKGAGIPRRPALKPPSFRSPKGWVPHKGAGASPNPAVDESRRRILEDLASGRFAQLREVAPVVPVAPAGQATQFGQRQTDRWTARVKDIFGSFEEFAQYDKKYGIAAKTGWPNAQAMWDHNPALKGMGESRPSPAVKEEAAAIVDRLLEDEAEPQDVQPAGRPSVPTFTFDELSPQAKEKAKDDYRRDVGYHWSDEAIKSLEALAAHFGGRLSDYDIDWGGGTRSRAEFDMPEMDPAEIEEKLNSLGSYDPGTLMGHGDCVLTGYAMDESAIDGFRKAWHGGERDLGKLMEAAYEEWLRDGQSDYEAQFSDEDFGEHCDANEYRFFEDGTMA